MAKYKPILWRFDEGSYRRKLEEANSKKRIYNKALSWAGQYIVIDGQRAFADSFTEYFKEQFFQANKNKIQLEVSVEKILGLMDISLKPLQDLENEFNSINIDYRFDGEEICFDVDEKPYQQWTKSAEQNKIVKDGRNLIDAINKLSEHTHIYPQQVMLATSNLIHYDIRTRKYSVALDMRRR